VNSFLPVSSRKLGGSAGGASELLRPDGLPHVMLMDMNSFFASVEQQANPRLRGRPVGVVASMHPTSTLIAASKEAKRIGIRTGTLIWKARKICPSIALCEAEPLKYRAVNRRVNKVLDSYSDRVEHYSIDESFLDLSESRISPAQVGVEIKRRIK
jgi:DNA polymerase IV